MLLRWLCLRLQSLLCPLLAGVFVSMFWLAYFVSPRFCHKFVGYLEEEAVKTYTHCLEVYTPHAIHTF